MEFNIVRRRPKYLTEGCTCIFDFQVDSKPEIYQVEMIYTKRIPHGIYYFKSENKRSADIDLFKDREDLRTEFRKELEKWSKGGSYRKTHPIILDKLGELKEERLKLYKREKEISDEIKIEEEKQREIKLKDYKKDIDFKLVNDFVELVDKFLEHSRFCLRNVNYDDLYLYDNGIEVEDIEPRKADLFL